MSHMIKGLIRDEHCSYDRQQHLLTFDQIGFDAFISTMVGYYYHERKPILYDKLPNIEVAPSLSVDVAGKLITVFRREKATSSVNVPFLKSVEKVVINNIVLAEAECIRQIRSASESEQKSTIMAQKLERLDLEIIGSLEKVTMKDILIPVAALAVSMSLCTYMDIDVGTAFVISMALVFTGYMYSDNINSRFASVITAYQGSTFHAGERRELEQPPQQTNVVAEQQPPEASGASVAESNHGHGVHGDCTKTLP